MLIALYPLAIMIAGLLVWLLASNPKASEAGRILFFCGALTLTWTLAGSTLRIGSGR
jgi:Na+/phosphate symporter